MMDPETFTVESADGTQLFGRHWTAEAPHAVMALVHGFGEHCGRYANMAGHLTANGISVVALDFHGHGNTPGPRGVIQSYDDFRADLASLLAKTQALYPDTPLVLYGHSMGGGIVLDHGFNAHPDIQAIIASAPLIALPKSLPKVLRGVTKLMGKIRPKGTMSQPIDKTKISTQANEQDAYENDPLNHAELGFRTAVGMIEAGESIAARAEEWDAPLLLLHSREDQLTSFAASQSFAEQAKNVSFQAYDVSDMPQHEMHNDITRAHVYARMTTFIQEQTA